MYGRSFRTYEIDRVIADIKNAKEHGAKAIFISDDNITLDLRRLETLSEEIVNNKLNSLHYIVQVTVKGMASSEKLVQKMADAGIKSAFVGIESVKKDNLDFIRKSVPVVVKPMLQKRCSHEQYRDTYQHDQSQQGQCQSRLRQLCQPEWAGRYPESSCKAKYAN